MKVLLVVVSAIGILAVAVAIVVGTGTFEGIVTEHPYEKGLNWDEERKERQRLGWSVQISPRDLVVGRNDMVLRLTDRGGAPLDATAVSMTVSRPSTTARDATFPFTRDHVGVFVATVDLPLRGYWDLDVVIHRGLDAVSLRRTIYARQ